jgi:hypothetical protein
LRTLDAEQFALVHRTWLWANLQRKCGDAELSRIGAAGESLDHHVQFTSVLGSHYLAWYSFLSAEIEALLGPDEGRVVDIRGLFGDEVDAMTSTLGRFRNAVFHVPRRDYHDRRLLDLFGRDETGAARIRRVHRGFGRLFLEEAEARRREKLAAGGEDAGAESRADGETETRG